LRPELEGYHSTPQTDYLVIAQTKGRVHVKVAGFDNKGEGMTEIHASLIDMQPEDHCPRTNTLFPSAAAFTS
jgi:hypothetical protein